MVLPFPGIEFLDDTVVPNEAKNYFVFIRFALYAQMVLAFLRIGLGDIAGALSDIICILFGIFFMKNDNSALATMHRYLADSMLAMCCSGGGFRVLMPYLFLSALNAVYNLLIFIQIPVIVPYTIICTLQGLAEMSCAYFGFQIYKSVSDMQLGGLFGGGGGGDYNPLGGGPSGQQSNRPTGPRNFGGGVLGGAGAGGGQSQDQQQAGQAGNQGFALFQGQGRRLGD